MDAILAKTLADLKEELLTGPKKTKEVDNAETETTKNNSDSSFQDPGPTGESDRDKTTPTPKMAATVTTGTVENVFGSAPMNPDQMQTYLQNVYYQKPIALRQQGTAAIKCPYCKKMHHHGEAGYQAAQCDYNDRQNGVALVIGDRYYSPGYGYIVCEYRPNGKGVMELLD